MIKVKKEDLNKIKKLFGGIEDSMVIACLQGYMGDAYVDSLDDPKAGLIVSGEYSFFAGDPKIPEAKVMAERLLDMTPGDKTVAIFSGEEPGWQDFLMGIKKNYPKAVPRFGILQKDYEFDEELLKKYMGSLPEGYEIVRFDGDLYDQAMSAEWSKEFCETFASKKEYLEKGFGYGVVTAGKLVSGASTMTVYDGGTETQVATNKKHRKKGLALSCAAAFLLECQRRKIRACWDAANTASKKMAIKLGYEYKGIYMTIHMHK